MEGRDSVELYNPQVSDNLKPKVGQEFKSTEDAYAFYNVYAREAGFSVRIDSRKRKKGTNELTWKQFVCYKEGNRDGTYQKKLKKLNGNGEINLIQLERNRGIVSAGCKAKLSVVKRQSVTNWVVSTFVEGHNHVLATPRKVHLLRSHRKGLDVKRALAKQFASANVFKSEQMKKRAMLLQLCSIVVADACLSEEGTEILRKALKSAHEKIKELNRSKGL